MTSRILLAAFFLITIGVPFCSAQTVTQLDEVVVRGHRLVERNYGIKRRGVVRFTDGMFKRDENFEIGQVIRLGKSTAQIMSVKLSIAAGRPDSATFRIKFYRYDSENETPGKLINTKVIEEKRLVGPGWLTFDLSDHNLFMRGDVFAAIEFIPNADAKLKILYDVKIGGRSKSFYKRDSTKQWTRPPHHYCLYVTALTEPGAPQEEDDVETPPTFTMPSDFSKEPFSIFVRLPKNYSESKSEHPVVYLLDGNAFFDAVSSTADKYAKKRKMSIDPIIVGLGYENAYVMDSLRDRDYVYPNGRADKYYDFITSKIKPRIDSAYRTNQSDQTIMGHSLGGYFVLYALSRSLEKPMFNNFVAASPSFYNDEYIIKRLDSLLNNNAPHEKVRVVTTIGEYERSKPDPFDDLTKILKDHKVNVESATYAKTEHMGTAISTFERGLLILFKHRQ